MARDRIVATGLAASSLAMVLGLFWNLSLGAEAAADARPAAGSPASSPTRKNVRLPGLVINFQERCVDLEGSVCLDQGVLELVACTKGSKEHESIVALTASPMHVHAALLLLGAKPGHPAMRKPLDKEGKSWADVPPSGDPVEVLLVFKSKDGKTVEHPISKFVAPCGEEFGEKPEDGEDREFPDTFLFAGSLLRSNGPGPRTYLTDVSGNVISIATFGDEVLCLPGIHSNANAALEWQVNATGLPEVGTKVVLRLRPRVRHAVRGGKADRPRSVRTSGTEQ